MERGTGGTVILEEFTESVLLAVKLKATRVSLIQTELDIDTHLCRNALAGILVKCRLELVMLHSFNSGLIQPHSDRANYGNVMRISIFVH